MGKAKSVLIEELERKLGELAGQWREQHFRGNLQLAQTIVEEYHAVMGELWGFEWDGEGLLPDSELPASLMPKYFSKRWNIK